jgi:DNA-binding NarL/FixJ family response regulator
MDVITIIIIDDHQIVREGIEAMLLTNKQIKIIGQASDYLELLSLLKKQNPDILLLDIALPGKSGIKITSELKENNEKIKILMLSGNTDEKNIIDSIKAGADGFLPKDTSKDELIEAIVLVNNGEKYFGANLSKVIYESYVHIVKTKNNENTATKLSERETEIIKLLSKGSSSKEIAEKLFISPRTVESHKANILSKLNLKTNADLIIYAIKNEIVKI